MFISIVNLIFTFEIDFLRTIKKYWFLENFSFCNSKIRKKLFWIVHCLLYFRFSKKESLGWKETMNLRRFEKKLLDRGSF